jgi:hypothetical protein
MNINSKEEEIWDVHEYDGQTDFNAFIVILYKFQYIIYKDFKNISMKSYYSYFELDLSNERDTAFITPYKIP